MSSLEFEDLRFDSSSALLCVGDTTAQLVGDHHLIPAACAKLEGDDVGVALLGRDLEDGLQIESVLDSSPAGTV